MEIKTLYLHCRIHHSNLELRTTLPVVAWQRIHIHLLQLDELGISNRNRFSEGIYLQPVFFVWAIQKCQHEHWLNGLIFIDLNESH